MGPLPSNPYIELHVPDAKTEQEFLRLAVHTAAMKYRAVHHKESTPPQTSSYDALTLQHSVG
jgi:hypothetical protein